MEACNVVTERGVSTSVEACASSFLLDDLRVIPFVRLMLVSDMLLFTNANCDYLPADTTERPVFNGRLSILVRKVRILPLQEHEHQVACLFFLRDTFARDWERLIIGLETTGEYQF